MEWVTIPGYIYMKSEGNIQWLALQVYSEDVTEKLYISWAICKPTFI